MEATVEKPASKFVQFWNEILVPRFVKYKHVLVAGLNKHSEPVIPKLEVRPGERILDAGAGFGDTAIELAKRVGPEGHVTAIDCCGTFMEYGRKDAAAAGIDNLSFVEADIQARAFAPEHDLVFSRFGTMFFENPVAALENMRGALSPGGRMTMIVWRKMEDNPWLSAAKRIGFERLPQPGADAQTCGPGPFSMANREMVTAQLKTAGYESIRFERVDRPFRVGDAIHDAIEFQQTLGLTSEVHREAGDRTAAGHDPLVAELTELLAPHVTNDGVVMASSSWVISATNPG